MSRVEDILVPDIGDFQDVPVIEIVVSPGDSVVAEDPLPLEARGRGPSLTRTSTKFAHSCLYSQRIRLVGVDAVFFYCFRDPGPRDFAIVGQRTERGHGHVVSIDFEKATQVLARVRLGPLPLASRGRDREGV